MMYPRLIPMAMLIVATAGTFTGTTVRAQAPTDSAVADSTPKKTSRFGGLVKKAKGAATSAASNKTVQGAAKGVACTVVPGAAISAATGTGPCANSGLVGSLKATIGGAATNG